MLRFGKPGEFSGDSEMMFAVKMTTTWLMHSLNPTVKAVVVSPVRGLSQSYKFYSVTILYGWFFVLSFVG